MYHVSSSTEKDSHDLSDTQVSVSFLSKLFIRNKLNHLWKSCYVHDVGKKDSNMKVDGGEQVCLRKSTGFLFESLREWRKGAAEEVNTVRIQPNAYKIMYNY